MSEIKNAQQERLVSGLVSAVALISLVMPLPSLGDEMSTYGAQMCEDVGIPLDECTLSGPEPVFEETSEPDKEVGKGGKAATLVGHARSLCEEQGVPLEDCRALPLSHRSSGQEAVPVSSFLTVPETLPPVDVVPAPAPEPASIVTSRPVPVQQQIVRIAPPPERPVQPIFREAGPPPAGAAFREFGGPSSREFYDLGFRDARLPRQAFEPDVRQGGQLAPATGPVFREGDVSPVDPAFREGAVLPIDPAFSGRAILPVDPAFREGAILPVDPAFSRGADLPVDPLFRNVRRAPPIFVDEPDDGFVVEERLEGPAFRRGRRGRCQREVRYSRPPSYRYVDCY